MIIYTVTLNVDHDIHHDWIDWMRNTHIPEVMATGHFVEARFTKVLVQEESGTTYSVQYLTESMARLQEYQQHAAPHLMQKTVERYGSKVVAFRTLLEVQEVFG